MEDESNNTGRNLRGWRESFNLTQTEFADMMGVPIRTYQDLEADRAKVRQVHINALKYGLQKRQAEANKRPPTRQQLQANPEVWAAFYRDGKSLAEIAKQFNTHTYHLSPWLTTPIRQAVYGTKREWPEPDYQWWAGYHEERCDVGPFDTREDCIAEFRGQYGDDAAGFLFEAAQGAIHISHYLPDSGRLMEQVCENFSEGQECDEDGDCRIVLTAEQERSLHEAIKAAVDKWQLDNNYLPLPWVFTHVRVQENIEPLVNETLPGDSAGQVES